MKLKRFLPTRNRYLVLALGLAVLAQMPVRTAKAELESDGTFVGKVDGFDDTEVEVLQHQHLYRFPRSWLRDRNASLVEGQYVEVVISNFVSANFAKLRVPCRDCGPAEPAAARTPASEARLRAR